MIYPKALFDNMGALYTVDDIKAVLRQYVFNRISLDSVGNPGYIKHMSLNFLKEIHDAGKYRLYTHYGVDTDVVEKVIENEFEETLLIPKELYRNATVIDSLLPENWK